ncbi:hypothetical protein V6N13_014447 [Hibiscus sabdariffa]|uniref:F-box protein n=1 Tax=Hibiscus sabdariffa TaxID=183260 RepID=A0ABR2RW56_9ROSI
MPLCSGVYANGAMHWLTHKSVLEFVNKHDKFIVAINLSTDNQQNLHLPDKDEGFDQHLSEGFNPHLLDKDEGFDPSVYLCSGVYANIFGPHTISHRFDFETIGVLGGNLCAMDSFDWRGYVGIWVMNKYGVKESWTWLFSIPLITCKKSLEDPVVHPLMYSYNGEQVFVERGGSVLFYYNLKMRHIGHIDTSILKSSDGVQICHQCLVPLNFE